MYKKEKGVTLILLIITVMVLMIIAGIIINSGIKSIREAQVQSLKTNMISMRMKGEEYVFDVSSHVGTAQKTPEEISQIKSQYLKGTPVKEGLPSEIKLSEKEEAYDLSSDDMKQMGLNELADTAKDYAIIYNIEEASVDVVYKPGLSYNNSKYYTLSSIEEAGI